MEKRLLSLMNSLPNVQRKVLCEEKYDFTPDRFKAGTRDQRNRGKATSISHLKTDTMILSETTFDKEAIMNTMQGKVLISNYIGANVSKLVLKKDIIIDIDSQHHVQGCTCNAPNNSCHCVKYCVPIRATFSKSGFVREEPMDSIHQRKGEGEMAQVDWLHNCINDLKEEGAIASYLTSGDIDSIPIHLYFISSHWPRNQDGTFKHPVFCILRKPNSSVDVYNMTAIINAIEKEYTDPNICKKIAIALCMGGNDFVPRLYRKNHTSIFKLSVQAPFISTLIKFEGGCITLDHDVYIELIKLLYTRRTKAAMEYNEVRKDTMYKGTTKVVTMPQQWLPPESVMRRVANLVQFQIDYFDTLGKHDADMPDFASRPCLTTTESGNTEYDFGPEVHMENVPQTIFTTPKKDKKRLRVETPRKGLGRKKTRTSTPKKVLLQ